MTPSSSYLPIHVSALLPAQRVGLDLFIAGTPSPDQQREESQRSKKDSSASDPGDSAADSDDQEMRLYRSADLPLLASDLQRLQQRGVRHLFIESCHQSVYQTFLEECSDPQNLSGDETLLSRLCVLSERTRDGVRLAMEQQNVDAALAVSKTFARSVAEIFFKDAFTNRDVFLAIDHDVSTYTHIVNVAFFAALLATRLGYSAGDVEKIAVGGLLHDLGKMDISEGIVCKPGRLTDEEFRLIKMHPTFGFRRLAQREDILREQLLMVYQHHERFDGGGYPVGLTGRETHPWSRLCAVVDVFEALTSHRPYRMPMKGAKALEIQNRDKELAFDPEMLRCWELIIQNDWID